MSAFSQFIQERGRALRSVLAALGLAAAFVLPAPGAFAQSEQFVTLVRGQASTVVVAPFSTITVETDAEYANLVVGKPEIADAVPLSGTSLYIQGNAPGRTNISVYGTDKKLIGVIDVIVELDVTELRRAIASAAPRGQVRVDVVNGAIRLSGKLPDGATLQQVLEIAKEYGGDRVINAVRVTDSQQVMLEVRFLEARRNAGRELGIGLRGSGGDGRGATDPSLVYSLSPFSSLITKLIDTSGLSVDIVINALEERGSVRRLAEPNLVALSGQTADFLAGGEVPVPQVTDIADNGVAKVDVAFKEYGVKLGFTPVVMEDGLINVNLKAEVSELDFNTAITIGDQEIPGFATRRTNTVVELRDGQSFSVSGLLQATNVRSQRQVPWLGQIPVLGALFRSTGYQKNETDLVVIVTPHIVRPASPNEPLESPLDRKAPSNDAELFLMGMLEVDKDMIHGFETGAGVAGPYGHILKLPVGAAHAVQK